MPLNNQKSILCSSLLLLFLCRIPTALLYHVRWAAMVPPAELSAWISAASAETRMRWYNARCAPIMPPADFSIRLSAGNAESGMRWYNILAVNIIPSAAGHYNAAGHFTSCKIKKNTLAGSRQAISVPPDAAFSWPYPPTACPGFSRPSFLSASRLAAICSRLSFK